jgi:hypothetical protein
VAKEKEAIPMQSSTSQPTLSTPDDSTVVLFDVDSRTNVESEAWRGTLREFFADNEFDADEQDAIRRHLSRKGHVFGGGAAAIEVLRVAEVQP